MPVLLGAEDICLTDGSKLPTMVVTARLPYRLATSNASTRGGEMSAQFRSPASKGRQTCFLVRFSADIAA
jgi:hypothetical protein